MPTRLLHLTGPVEQQIHIQRAQGITASLLQTKEASLPYCMAAGFSVGDDRPLPVGLGIAPENTRVPVKWPLDTSVDDLMSYLPIRIRHCRCLPPLLDAAKVRDINTTEMLLRGYVDAIGNIGLYWFLICTSSTQEPSYAGPDASAGLVSTIFSAQVAWMKSQCDLKQGFKFEIAPVNRRVPVKWPLDTSVHDLLSYLQDKSSFKGWREKFKNDDGIELMIPAKNKDLIPDILRNWIKSKKVDIKSEYDVPAPYAILHTQA
nr:unnamed protein product [Digitaria exilis]